MKQKHTHQHRKQTYYWGGRGWGRDKLEFRDQHIQTTIYKKGKQGPTVQRTQYPVINHNGKEYDKGCIVICITASGLPWWLRW